MDNVIRPVRIRPIRPSDREALERFYADLSVDSRHARFMAACRGLTPGQSSAFCTPDHHHREGFVAELPQQGGPARIVGHVCLEPDDADGAEVAIAVADDLQHHGLGHRLMETALDWARREGIRRFSATMLPGNAPIHRLLAGLGLPAHVRPIGTDLAAISIDIADPPAAA